MPLSTEPTNPKWTALDHLLDFVGKKKDSFGVDILFQCASSGKASYLDINSSDVWTSTLADQEAESASAEVDAVFTALETMEETIRLARDSTDMHAEEQ